MLRSPRAKMNLRNLKTRNQPTTLMLPPKMMRKKRTAMKKNPTEDPL